MGRWFLTIALVLAVSTVEMKDGLHFETASRQVGEQGSETEVTRDADVEMRCNRERRRGSTTASVGCRATVGLVILKEERERQSHDRNNSGFAKKYEGSDPQVVDVSCDTQE
jgi:hypothetical protein